MFGVIIWIIIIYIIVVKVKQEQNDKTSTTNRRIQSTSNQSLNSSSYPTQRSSYYRPDKIDSYKRMNSDHADHDGDEGNLTDEIGYIKCPHCGATVSKKSETCFMCDKSLK